MYCTCCDCVVCSCVGIILHHLSSQLRSGVVWQSQLWSVIIQPDNFIVQSEKKHEQWTNIFMLLVRDWKSRLNQSHEIYKTVTFKIVPNKLYVSIHYVNTSWDNVQVINRYWVWYHMELRWAVQEAARYDTFVVKHTIKCYENHSDKAVWLHRSM